MWLFTVVPWRGSIKRENCIHSSRICCSLKYIIYKEYLNYCCCLKSQCVWCRSLSEVGKRRQIYGIVNGLQLNALPPSWSVSVTEFLVKLSHKLAIFTYKVTHTFTSQYLDSHVQDQLPTPKTMWCTWSLNSCLKCERNAVCWLHCLLFEF